MSFRIGQGYDVHSLDKEYELWLGGIMIPHYKGAIGHSDADVLIHAICDALLGAANLRDIGYHFSDKSPEFKNIDSKILLKRVIELISNKNYKIINIDSTICLEKPKLSQYIPLMKKTLAEVISIPEDNISIKATTTEKLGFVGKEKGISAYAIALIEK